MYGKHFMLAVLCGLALFFSSCASETGIPSETQETAGELPNYLVQAEGEIHIRRAGWANFLPTGFGALVEPGDLLRVEAGGLASVFCGSDASWDDSLVSLSADGIEHGVPCRSGRPPRPREDVAALRGASGVELPYIISPRNTALRDPRPTIRWHKLEGIESYTVTLIGEDMLDRSPVETGSSEILWPEDWPPLEHGASYVLVVEAGDRISSAGSDTNIGKGFWLLDQNEIKRINALEAALQAQSINSLGMDLLLAALLERNNLRAEAADLLASALGSQQSPDLWLNFARIQLETGLALEAIEAFNQAARSAEATGQLDVEADGMVGLGLAYRQLGDEAEAQSYFQKAIAIFQQIGDQDGRLEANKLKEKPGY